MYFPAAVNIRGLRLLLILVLFTSVDVVAASNTVQGKYLDIYLLRKRSEEMERTGKILAASADNSEVLHRLLLIREQNPTWQVALVDQSINSCRKKLAELEPAATTEALQPSVRASIAVLYQEGIQSEAQHRQYEALDDFELCRMILLLNQKHSPDWRPNFVKRELEQTEMKVSEIAKQLAEPGKLQ